MYYLTNLHRSKNYAKLRKILETKNYVKKPINNQRAIITL